MSELRKVEIDVDDVTLERLYQAQADLNKRNWALDELRHACKRILNAIGEDPERPGLKDTPDRFARMWSEFIHYDPGNTETVFEGVTANQMVVVSGMRVWSMCEHHMLPFHMDVSVGVIARDHILGLSKFARIAHKHGHALQIQERYVVQVADEIEALLGCPDVAVVASGVHLCMEMRGIKTHGVMTSSVMRGAFQDEGPARAEFLTLHHQSRNGRS